MTEKVTTYFVAGVLTVACCANAETDLDEYVALIRESGMSESAVGSVGTVATILSGDTTFRATRGEDGSPGRSYGPPTHATQAVLASRAASREAWTEFLKDQADTDGSGFVSTKEGQALRRRVETGLVAAQLRSGSIQELSEAAPEASEEDLAAYAAMRAEAVKQGLQGMPALPESLDTTPR